MSNQEKPASPSSQQVLEKKLTSLALYVTAQEAYELWRADPERVKILDVRALEAYLFVGHAEMVRNIPIAINCRFSADITRFTHAETCQ